MMYGPVFRRFDEPLLTAEARVAPNRSTGGAKSRHGWRQIEARVAPNRSTGGAKSKHGWRHGVVPPSRVRRGLAAARRRMPPTRKQHEQPRAAPHGSDRRRRRPRTLPTHSDARARQASTCRTGGCSTGRRRRRGGGGGGGVAQASQMAVEARRGRRGCGVLDSVFGRGSETAQVGGGSRKRLAKRAIRKTLGNGAFVRDSDGAAFASRGGGVVGAGHSACIGKCQFTHPTYPDAVHAPEEPCRRTVHAPGVRTRGAVSGGELRNQVSAPEEPQRPMGARGMRRV